jgi:hypothetical protein
LEIKKRAHHIFRCLGALSLRKLLSAAFVSLSETLLEFSYATTGIKNSLLAGVKGMAYGTNFNIN